MKKLLPLFLAFVVQMVLIFLVPAISTSGKDRLILSLCCLVFFLIFSVGAIRMMGAGEISQSKFNARFFGSMGLRMIICLSTIGIYLAISEVKTRIGSIFLVISYFIYMGFEIRIILHKLRTDSEKSKNADNARK